MIRGENQYLRKSAFNFDLQPVSYGTSFLRLRTIEAKTNIPFGSIALLVRRTCGHNNASVGLDDT
jgi:hypothetical protein